MPHDSTDDRRDEPPDDEPREDGESPRDRETDRTHETDEPSGERNESHPTDGSAHPVGERDSGGRSNAQLLSVLFDALASLERRSQWTKRGGQSRLEYDVSIGSGLNFLKRGTAHEGRERADPTPTRFGDQRPMDRTNDRSQPRTRRRSPSSFKTTVRRDDDRVEVVADIAGADPDAVTAGFVEGDFVVAIDDSEIERVDVPWSDPSAAAHVRNDVLTVTITDGGGERE